MINAFINDVNLREEYGMYLLHKEISPPLPKERYVDIPGGDGAEDLTTALTNGDVKYNNRTISMELGNADRSLISEIKYRKFSNTYHGQSVRLSFSDSVGYYWKGRLKIDSWTNDDKITEIKMTCTAQPYALETLDSTEDWIWDTFNFRIGVIRGYKNIVISGTGTVTVYGSRKRVCPEIICSADMSLIFGGTTYQLVAGTNRIIDIILEDGLQEFTFVGNGTVTIRFRGGIL